MSDLDELGQYARTSNAPVYQPRKTKKGVNGNLVFAIVAGVVTLVFFAFIASRTQSPPPPPAQAIFVPATQLVREYIENEIRADAAYRGKLLQIMGTVTDVHRTITDEAYVTFETLSGQHTIRQVQCFFSRAAEADLAAIDVGDGAEVTGICEGLNLNVLIRRCRVVSIRHSH